ncbi:monooxygenase [Rhodobacterales bacterium HKCCE3408]|nr:monooxygenase [Rhodobacterales bacterium HKCCE3408]
MARLRIGIAGAGIGGTFAALSLLKTGHDVRLYEQAGQVREVGAGIQISPNASLALHELGLADALAGLGVRPEAWHQRRWDDGRTLLRTPLARVMEAEFGAPHYQMHRADVLETLIGALPDGILHPAHKLTGFDDSGDRVTLRFASGETAEVDLLIGADGIHSTVREQLFGPSDPHFTGCVCYRGLIPFDRIAHLDIPVEAQVWMGPGKHFVHYYVRNRELLNFVAVIDQDTWQAESWTEACDPSEAIIAFGDWHPQIGGILAAVDETFVWALFDRRPMQAWSRGRVTLLGDACHPMLPFVAQGAAQAIEDGATLATCLSGPDAGDVAGALRDYESLRIPRTSKVQSLAAGNKQRFHMPDGPDQAARDAEMARNVTDWSLKSVAWLYGHNAWQPEAPAPAAGAAHT